MGTTLCCSQPLTNTKEVYNTTTTTTTTTTTITTTTITQVQIKREQEREEGGVYLPHNQFF
jgi:hypothetical protein